MVKTLALRNMQDARRFLGSGAETGGAADGTDGFQNAARGQGRHVRVGMRAVILTS